MLNLCTVYFIPEKHCIPFFGDAASNGQENEPKERLYCFSEFAELIYSRYAIFKRF